MKTSASIISLVSLVMLLAAGRESKANDPRTEVSGLKQEQLQIRVDREMIGAQVNVLYSNRTILISEKLRKRRVVIDFGAASVGEYTISIQKGDVVKTYHFLKI